MNQEEYLKSSLYQELEKVKDGIGSVKKVSLVEDLKTVLESAVGLIALVELLPQGVFGISEEELDSMEDYLTNLLELKTAYYESQLSCYTEVDATNGVQED